MVLATQNPVEQEGTYPLPEAQMDRFLMHIFIDYPDEASELQVIRLVRGEEQQSTQKRPARNRSRLPRTIFLQPVSKSKTIHISRKY